MASSIKDGRMAQHASTNLGMKLKRRKPRGQTRQIRPRFESRC